MHKKHTRLPLIPLFTPKARIEVAFNMSDLPPAAGTFVFRCVYMYFVFVARNGELLDNAIFNSIS